MHAPFHKFGLTYTRLTFRLQHIFGASTRIHSLNESYFYLNRDLRCNLQNFSTDVALADLKMCPNTFFLLKVAPAPPCKQGRCFLVYRLTIFDFGQQISFHPLIFFQMKISFLASKYKINITNVWIKHIFNKILKLI